MTDPTEQIVVLRTHLEEVHDALSKAHGYIYAQDLADGYREVKPGVRTSRLAALVARNAERVESYLREEDDD